MFPLPPALFLIKIDYSTLMDTTPIEVTLTNTEPVYLVERPVSSCPQVTCPLTGRVH